VTGTEMAAPKAAVAMATATVEPEKRSRMTISFSLAAYYRNEILPCTELPMVRA